MASTTLANRDGEEVLFEGRAALVPSFATLLAAILTLGLWLLVRWFRTLGTSYRITTRRIVVETGVLSKKLEQIDLYRVENAETYVGQRLRCEVMEVNPSEKNLIVSRRVLLERGEVRVNGALEDRRGRQLARGDVVTVGHTELRVG